MSLQTIKENKFFVTYQNYSQKKIDLGLTCAS